MVGGDLRARRADAGKNGGFAYAGHTDQSHVGQHLQLQYQFSLLALGAVFGEHGHLTSGGGKVLVAPAAAAAAAADKGLVIGHILDDLARFCIADQRARRHQDHHVLGGGTVKFLAAAVAAVFGHEFAVVAEKEQRGGAGIDLEDDVTAVAAVTAGGAAPGNVFLAVEGYGTVAAVTGLDVNFGFVYDSLGITHRVPPRLSGG